jgi:predicted ATPase
MILASAVISAIMLIFGVITFIIVMLLPAFIELKKPKDAGPKILENGEQHEINVLVDMESEIKFDWVIVRKVAEIIAFLPSLEP